MYVVFLHVPQYFFIKLWSTNLHTEFRSSCHHWHCLNVAMLGVHAEQKLMLSPSSTHQSPGRGAALSGCSHGSKQHGPHHHLHVSVFSHDDGIVTAKLQDLLAKPFLDPNSNLLTYLNLQWRWSFNVCVCSREAAWLVSINLLALYYSVHWS